MVQRCYVASNDYGEQRLPNIAATIVILDGDGALRSFPVYYGQVMSIVILIFWWSEMNQAENVRYDYFIFKIFAMY